MPSRLDDLPQVHPRQAPTTRARNVLAGFLSDLRQTYELTPSEEFALLAGATADLASTCIRSERRPDDEDA